MTAFLHRKDYDVKKVVVMVQTS